MAIYPAFDPGINEMAVVWKHLCNQQKLACTVIAGERDLLKGRDVGRSCEGYENLTIRRFPVRTPTSELVAVALEAKPDLIFAAVHDNVGLARDVQRHLNVPIVLHNEFFLDDVGLLLRRRYHLGVPMLRHSANEIYRRYLHRVCARICISNPVEQGLPGWKRYQRLRYLPWPCPVEPTEADHPPRDLNRALYIGSLSRWKGAQHLQQYFAALLRALPNLTLTLVGPAVDQTGIETLRLLQGQFGKRVRVEDRCSRPEALALIASALFTFSPAQRFGWGLIDDSWGCGTPIVSVSEHYDLRDDENCLVAHSEADFVRQVRALQTDAFLRDRLAQAGRVTVTSHGVDHVARTLLATLDEAAVAVR